ncbi:MAG TPA: hypothetical protein VN894_07090, partial [Polyangiaceae bacterium]|nr:hypothetical protein [Polyangiaceae bacterium]
MANSRRDKMPFARTKVAAAFGVSVMAVMTAACTPATPDSTGTGGNASGSSGGVTSGGSSNGGGGS